MHAVAIRMPLAAAFLVAALGGHAAPASAQAARSWVSGVGDDVNPCSRTAPCKTFAGAISKTLAGGEINCLDDGGYGTLLITKAISIICDGHEAGVATVGGLSGFTIKAGPRDVVLLSGLDIAGSGTGGSGVRFLSGRALYLRNSMIHGFTTADGTGVTFDPAAPAKLYLRNMWISDNMTGLRVGGAGGAAAEAFLSDNSIVGSAVGMTTTGGAAIHARGGNMLANDRDGDFASVQGTK